MAAINLENEGRLLECSSAYEESVSDNEKLRRQVVTEMYMYTRIYGVGIMCLYVFTCVLECMHICFLVFTLFVLDTQASTMGWLRLVGTLKL